MRRTYFFVALLASAGIVSGATPYYTAPPSDFTASDTTNWSQNGTPFYDFYNGVNGIGAPSAAGTSLISKLAVPDGTAEYEVNTTYTFGTTGAAGTFIHYLRASPNAIIGTGTYISVELSGIGFANGGCGATLNINQRVNNVVTSLALSAVPCANPMIVRSVVYSNLVWVLINGSVYGAYTTVTGGAPGVGCHDTTSGNKISAIQLVQRSHALPAAIDPSTIGTSVFPNQVNVQWREPADSTGVGIVSHIVNRNGGYWGQSFTGVDYTDAVSVAPSTQYTYQLQDISFHGITGQPVQFVVTTPPAGAIDPRRTGVRPTGAYWGAMGEQIDTLSGNVNYSIPLLKAQGRGGLSLALGLSYNSQNWRQDTSTNGSLTWKLGDDVGYGFGWSMRAGSLTPYWNGGWWGQIDHYVFTDSTGAQYKLNVNTNGVWSSQEGVYIYYDTSVNRLYFPDGTFWVMGCLSAGTEADAGTSYPTLVEDSNGNQIILRYLAGARTNWLNSSARIDSVEDSRAGLTLRNGAYQWATYVFTYNTDATPHLTKIQNYIGTAENYTFTTAPLNLNSPFWPYPTYPATSQLTNIAYTGLSWSYSIYYDGTSNGSGELAQVMLPYGGRVGWQYRNFTYVGGRTMREISGRSLLKDWNGVWVQYTMNRADSVDANLTIHSQFTLDDASGGGREDLEVQHQRPALAVGNAYAVPAAQHARRHAGAETGRLHLDPRADGGESLYRDQGNDARPGHELSDAIAEHAGVGRLRQRDAVQDLRFRRNAAPGADVRQYLYASLPGTAAVRIWAGVHSQPAADEHGEGGEFVNGDDAGYEYLRSIHGCGLQLRGGKLHRRSKRDSRARWHLLLWLLQPGKLNHKHYAVRDAMLKLLHHGDRLGRQGPVRPHDQLGYEFSDELCGSLHDHDQRRFELDDNQYVQRLDGADEHGRAECGVRRDVI